MKKVIAVLVVLGLIFSVGAGTFVSAGEPNDYLDLPDMTYPVPR